MPTGIDWLSKLPECGQHTVTSAEATANAASIATGKVAATAFHVQIFRSGVNVMSDAVVSISSGVLAVADGGATYNMTAGDVINWQVW